MPWKKPILPLKLTKGQVISGFKRIRKPEMSVDMGNLVESLNASYRSIPWVKLELRTLARFKMITTFDKGAFDQVFDEAREVAQNNCPELFEQCIQVRDQVLEIEKNEADDAAKQLLIEMSEQADLLSQSVSPEVLEAHLQEAYDQHMAALNQQLQNQFKQLKAGFVRIVKDIKKVIELEFDASSETAKVASAITFGYVGIHNIIKLYHKYVEQGIGDINIETFENDLAPLTKYSGDKSLFSFSSYSEFYERDGKAIVTEETDADAVKNHCITLLKAVRALPSRYKD